MGLGDSFYPASLPDEKNICRSDLFNLKSAFILACIVDMIKVSFFYKVKEFMGDFKISWIKIKKTWSKLIFPKSFFILMPSKILVEKCSFLLDDESKIPLMNNIKAY